MTITERLVAIVDSLNEMMAVYLEAEAAGYVPTQDELRILFERLKRMNDELGRAQFDMMNSPLWEYMTEEDRSTMLDFVNKTIVGWNMIKEAMGESLEANR